MAVSNMEHEINVLKVLIDKIWSDNVFINRVINQLLLNQCVVGTLKPVYT
jgi:hypothetical protein